MSVRYGAGVGKDVDGDSRVAPTPTASFCHFPPLMTGVVSSPFTLLPAGLYLSQLFRVQVTETQLELAYKGFLNGFIEV